MGLLVHKARSNKGHVSNRDRRTGLRICPFWARRVSIGWVFWPTVIFVTLALIRNVQGATADSQSYSEYQVKAAFLYNFARFVEWPKDAFPDNQAPILLGVVGEDPFGGALEQVIKGKTVNGRELVLKRLTRQQDLKGFHMLFVSSSEARHLSQIMESLRGKCVLTVGETEGFAQTGGVINFTLEENKVHFEINVDTAERAHLKISSKLLALAKVLKEEHPDARK